MNNLQKHLLEMLNEIDVICKKNNITYYAAGGTVIGAIRNDGFLPWDDDIDIYMTRPEYNKFLVAYNKEKPVDRILECRELNPDYPGTVNRYYNISTTRLSRYHLLDACTGGISIDILIMDPIPNDRASRIEYWTKLNIYSDLVIPLASFSHRNTEKYMDHYAHYIKRVQDEGLEPVIKELEEYLFGQKQNECDCYTLCRAGVPLLFPKEMMGEPSLHKFENTIIPLPSDYIAYLQYLYGYNWVEVPYVSTQITHTTIQHFDIPYNEFAPTILANIDQKQLLTDLNNRKTAAITYEQIKIKTDRELYRAKIQEVLLTQSKIIEQSPKSPQELFDAKEYKEILSLFKIYDMVQTSSKFIGDFNKKNWRRYLDPIYIPIDDSLFVILMYSYIYTDNISKAARLTEIRKFQNDKTPQTINAVTDLIHILDDIFKCFYCGTFDKVLTLFDDLSDDAKQIASIQGIYWQSLIACTDEKYPLNKIQKELSAMLCDSSDITLVKAYADLLYKLEETTKAKEMYTGILNKTRNGMIWKDINSKTDLDLSNVLSQSAPVDSINEDKADNIAQLKSNFLLEIKNICDKNKIDYALHGKTAKYAILTGSINSVKHPTILINQDHMQKFIKKVKQQFGSSRIIQADQRTDEDSKLTYKYMIPEITEIHYDDLDKSVHCFYLIIKTIDRKHSVFDKPEPPVYIDFLGYKFPVYKKTADKIKTHEIPSDTNTHEILSLKRCISPYFSYEELLPLIDIQAIKEIDWASLAAHKSTLYDCKQTVKEYWQTLLDKDTL